MPRHKPTGNPTFPQAVWPLANACSTHTKILLNAECRATV